MDTRPPLDLTDPALADAHPLGHLRLDQATAATDLSQAPATRLSQHLFLARLELLPADPLGYLIELPVCRRGQADVDAACRASSARSPSAASSTR